MSASSANFRNPCCDQNTTVDVRPCCHAKAVLVKPSSTAAMTAPSQPPSEADFDMEAARGRCPHMFLCKDCGQKAIHPNGAGVAVSCEQRERDVAATFEAHRKQVEGLEAALRERSKNYHYSEHPWGLRWKDCQQEPCISDRRRTEEAPDGQ